MVHIADSFHSVSHHPNRNCIPSRSPAREVGQEARKVVEDMSAPLAAVIACTMLLTLSLSYLYRNYFRKVVKSLVYHLEQCYQEALHRLPPAPLLQGGRVPKDLEMEAEAGGGKSTGTKRERNGSSY